MLDVRIVEASALGYAFMQCLESDIAITREINSDMQKLTTLKELAIAYSNVACTIEANKAQLIMCPISKGTIDRVLKATSLENIY